MGVELNTSDDEGFGLFYRDDTDNINDTWDEMYHHKNNNKMNPSLKIVSKQSLKDLRKQRRTKRNSVLDILNIHNSFLSHMMNKMNKC